VKEAVVGEGPTFKRMMARARGSGSRILKRTSHIRIVLSDEIQIETRETRKKKRQQEKKESRKQATSGEPAENRIAATEKTPKAKKSAGKKAKK